MRIAVAQFAHETVTFLRNDTGLEDFVYEGSPLAGEALLASGPTSYMGGFVQTARDHIDVDLVGLTSPMFPRTGIGSGWITREAFETLLSAMLSELRDQGPFEGVYLALHGAMAVRGVPRPEAAIARRFREAVGPRAVIAATFDPHGNEDRAFLEHADLALCAKYYPHYDEHLQGARAAQLLIRTVRGRYRPVHAICRPPILTPTIMQCTDAGVWAELVRRALVWEARWPGLVVNLFFGFPWNDAPDAGFTVQATSDGDCELARRAVESLANFAWRCRRDLVAPQPILTMAEAVARAKDSPQRPPLVLADYSDRTGRATWLLQEIVRQELPNALVATVADSRAAARVKAFGAGPGDDVEIQVGGGPEEADGEAVTLLARLLGVHDVSAFPGFGGNSPWLTLEFGRGCMIIVTPFLTEVRDPQVLKALLGLNAGAFDVIAVKSRVHFRAGFVESGFTDRVLIVEPEAPFLGTRHLTGLSYENLDLQSYFPYAAVELEPDLAAEDITRVDPPLRANG